MHRHDKKKHHHACQHSREIIVKKIQDKKQNKKLWLKSKQEKENLFLWIKNNHITGQKAISWHKQK